MKIESMTVKILRSGESFSNDTIDLHVAIEDGDDWEAIGLELRKRAEWLIEEHWREKREAEEAYRKMEKVQRAERDADAIKLRDEYLEGAGEKLDCEKCPVSGAEFKADVCDGCPMDEAPW